MKQQLPLPGSRCLDWVSGISELLYAGSGEWNFMYGIPDVVGLMRVYQQWRDDGQARVHGEVYPGIPIP